MLKENTPTSLKHTPLYREHQALGALLVNFAGYEMPLHYGSQIDEHHRVRQDAGIFDVSHMGVVDIQGDGVQDFLRQLLANSIDKLKVPGKALYSCMLNPEGGVKDDLIVYFISPTYYRLVVNAGTLEKDLQWMKKHAESFAVSITHRSDLAILAVQGPKVRDKLSHAFPAWKEALSSLKPFQFIQQGNQQPEEYFIARTGYTGEDGVEIILPNTLAENFWKTCLDQGITPIGLGARDTLRLEAGLNLYGQDMDETVTPLESNLAWTVSFEPTRRQFIGRTALEAQQRDGVSKKLVGLVLQERGVLRRHQIVLVENQAVGEITSGTFSPTLKQAIGFARVASNVEQNCWIEIRGKQCLANIVPIPFVRGDKQ